MFYERNNVLQHLYTLNSINKLDYLVIERFIIGWQCWLILNGNVDYPAFGEYPHLQTFCWYSIITIELTKWKLCIYGHENSKNDK